MARRPHNRPSKTKIDREEEIIALDTDAAFKVWLKLQVEKGKMAAAEADELFKEHSQAVAKGSRQFWNERKQAFQDRPIDSLKAGRRTQPLAMAAITTTRIFNDLGRNIGKTRVTTYNGVQYIIFKGNHKTRKLIAGTRYALRNPKMISLGIGQQGVKSAARKGAIIGLIVVSALNVANFILKDEYTLSHFIGDMAVDVAVIAASAALGALAGAIIVGTGLVAAFTVGPLLVAAAVTFYASVKLGQLADHYEIREKITSAIDDLVDGVREKHPHAFRAPILISPLRF